MRFKVGDRVRCIDNKKPIHVKGVGLKLGLMYNITSVIRKHINSFDENCYFGGRNKSGVYESHLELVKSKNLTEFEWWELMSE